MIRRRLRDAVLLPIALLVVVLEDVIWAGAKRVLRGVSALPPVHRLELWMGTLPAWAALPLFLIPEGLGRLGEGWAIVLLAQGRVVAAANVYIWVRLLATLLAVFVYQACAAALLGLPWFAWGRAQLLRVRDWAMAFIAPLRARLRRLREGAPGAIRYRLAALRHRLRRALPRCGS